MTCYDAIMARIGEKWREPEIWLFRPTSRKIMRQGRAGRAILSRSLSWHPASLRRATQDKSPGKSGLVFAPGGPAAGNITIMFQGRRTPPDCGGEASGNVRSERITRACYAMLPARSRSSAPAAAGPSGAKTLLTAGIGTMPLPPGQLAL